ncbi:hypothetical protein KI387_011988, partial [Taxus chinensis]
LATAQSTATEIEDDLILAGRIKKDIPKLKNQGSSQGNTDPMFQKMANDLISLKKQVSQQGSNVPYRDIPRQNFNNNGVPARDRPRLALAQPRLAIEAPPVNAAVELIEEDDEPEEQDSPEDFEASGYADESYDESAGDSSI